MDLSISQKVKKKQLTHLYQSLPNALITTIILVSLIFILLRQHFPLAQLLIWSGLMLMVVAFRWATAIIYTKQIKRRHNTQTENFFDALFLVGVILAAIGWGALGCWIYPHANLASQIILLPVLFGVPAGAMTSLAYKKKPISLFIILDLGLTVFGQCLYYNECSLFVIIGFMLYLWFLLKTSLLFQKNNENALYLTEKALRHEEMLQQAKKQEEQLRREQELILNTTGDGIFGINMDGKINFINSAALQLVNFGFTLDRYYQDIFSFTDMMGNDYPPDRHPVYSCMEQKKINRNSGFFVLRNSKKRYPINFTCSPVLEAGKVTGAVVSFTDITDKIQAEKALHDSEEKFRIIATAATDAIVLINQKCKVSYWNRAAEVMFAFTESEIIGKEFASLIDITTSPELPNKTEQNITPAERFGTSDKLLEITAIKKDGTLFPAEISTSPVIIKGYNQTVGIIRDISQRKKAESESLKVEKLKSLGILAGGIAHDFNNILMAILGNLNLAVFILAATTKLS